MMQQTKTYKLNLIEPTDPFSPAPLNENTQTAEAQFAALHAAAARHCIDKLLGPLTVAEGEEELTIDLSGFDLAQYGALVCSYTVAGLVGKAALCYDGTAFLNLLTNGEVTFRPTVNGGGIALLFPGGGRIYGVAPCGGYNSSGKDVGGTARGSVTAPWAGLESLALKAFTPESSIVIYGIRR